MESIGRTWEHKRDNTNYELQILCIVLLNVCIIQSTHTHKLHVHKHNNIA